FGSYSIVYMLCGTGWALFWGCFIDPEESLAEFEREVVFIMKYLFITDCPEIATYVDQCGVHCVFIDLELLGKVERQGGRDTVISHHKVENISRVKDAVQNAEVLVRLNSLNPQSSV